VDIPGPVADGDTILGAIGKLQQQINQVNQAGLPMGAVGIWYADRYQSTPRRVIPNAMATVPAPANLLNMPRRKFNNTQFWNKSNITVVDNAATAADGAMEASTLVGTGDCFLFPTAPVLPAGTYTLAISAKRNTGTDQTFTQQFFSAGLTSPTRTATSAWQRFYFTGSVSAGSQTLFVARSVASGGFNLQVADAVLWPGTVDQSNEPDISGLLSGHLYLGQNQFIAQPAVAAGEIDFTGDGWGAVQFPATPLSAYTVLAVARRTTNDSSNNAILSAGPYTTFAPMYDQAASVQAYFGGGGGLGQATVAGAYKLFNRGWKVHAHRNDGTNASVYVNGCRVSHGSVAAVTPVTINDLLVGAFDTVGNFIDYKVCAIALYPRALSEAEVERATLALTVRAAASSFALTDDDLYWRAEGDSITADVNSYCLKYGANSTQNLLGARSPLSGGTVAGLVTRAADLDVMIPASPGNKRFVLSILIGANDLTGATTTTQFLTSLASYLDARRAAGWIVVLCTILPNTNAGFNAKRNVANTEMRLWTSNGSTIPGKHADYICDFAADATVGTDAAASNPTYYPDGVHPSNAGHVILETIFRPVMNSI
jgi:lysophospholipase L1-like esterase